MLGWSPSSCLCLLFSKWQFPIHMDTAEPGTNCSVFMVLVLRVGLPSIGWFAQRTLPNLKDWPAPSPPGARYAFCRLPMSLPHALLTALIECPSSGLDLANRFDRSIGFFWSATHQQIYRELGRLEAAGWVQSVPAESARGRKRLYQVLDAGRAELQRWIAQPVDPSPHREELMVRLRAEAVVGPTGLADEIARRLLLHRGKLALYRQIEARDFAAPDLSQAQRLQHLVLKAGIMEEQLWIQWSEEALGVLGAPAQPQADGAADSSSRRQRAK